MSELATLRASAERGMSEDAEPAYAYARERLLQRYRDAWIDHGHLELSGELGRSEPMGEADLAGIEWIARLAGAGHHGALRLLRRSLQQMHLENLHRVAPANVEALGKQLPFVAEFLAWMELRKPQPDWPRFDSWVAIAGLGESGIVQALQVLREEGGEPGEHERNLLRDGMIDLGPDAVFGPGVYAEKLLFGFAKQRWRHASTGDEKRRAKRLMQRAADLGSREAADYLFYDGWHDAPDKPRYLEEWFAAGRGCVDSAIVPCLELGAALERGAGGAPPDLVQAVRWYERALERSAWRSPGKLDKEFCYAVATAFDRRWRTSRRDEAEIAMRWNDRAIDLGDERCLDTWIKACAEGAMGLAADPAAALERARRFRASGADLKRWRWRFSSAIRAVHAAAAAAPDERVAAKWREVARLLETD